MMIFVLISWIAGCTDQPGQVREAHRMPMEEQFENSLKHTWLSKKVHRSLVIDDMESLQNWSTTGIGEISYTTERARIGTRSLRFRTSMRDEEHIRANINEDGSFDGNQGGYTRATLKFDQPQDWTDYNRISLWVYVHPTSMLTYSFSLSFRCMDAPSGIASPNPVSFIQDLKPGEWNHVVWEIPNLRRDKVTEFSISQTLRGHDPEDEGIVTYDIDLIELQLVDAEKYEGWEVAAGKIALNHVGYRPEQEKIAYASGLTVSDFRLVDVASQEVVATKPVETVTNERGTFQLLDFSDERQPGTYYLRAGDVSSRPFAISDRIWTRPITKAMNFFFCERCGYHVPGIHRVCHRDWQGIRNGVKKVINGGWHDAGDLSQGSFRTGMAVYAMMEIVDQLTKRNADPDLQALVLDEALWGLDWLLKTRFGDGYRITWSKMRIYTDCEIGTIDDVIAPARNIPWENFLFAAVAAYSYEVLKDRKFELANECLQAAREDWEAAVHSQPDWSSGGCLEASWGVVSSVNLYRATGERKYADRAAEFGQLLLSCQEQRFLDGIPITGYFYTDSSKQSIVHYNHAAFEESPLLALKALCDTFPGHRNWMDWYGAALLHSEYFLKRGSSISPPYNLIPNSVWRKSEILRVEDPQQREDMLRQFEEGTRLSDEYCLRTFPIWTSRTFHGNTAVHLSGTLALTAAVQLRGDLTGERLVDKQLQWVFGGNPFSQSLMYGEGYDYAPQFAYCLRDIVGAIPVGMDCMSNDEPYWSGSNYATYKEIWVVPVSRFLWIMSYVGMPALIEGAVREASATIISFYERRTGHRMSASVGADGKFRAILPAGDYKIECGSVKRSLSMVPDGNYQVALNPEHNIDFTVTVRTHDTEANIVQVEVYARGTGRHKLAIRAFNGAAREPVRAVDLGSGKNVTVNWDVQIADPSKPWAAVVVPDGDITWKRELTGTMEKK
jgi:hypothetical protein